MGVRRIWTAGVVAAVLAVGGIGAASVASAGPDQACSVTYTVQSEWQDGFTANVAVRNTGSAPVDGWTLGWEFPDGQTVRQGWNGEFVQEGAGVEVADAEWNARIAPNSTLQFGFLAARTGANTVPGTFTLNGLTCTGGAAPTGTATSTGTGTAPPSPAPTPPDTTTPTRTATGTGTGSAEPTGTVTATGTAAPPGTPLGSGRIQYGPTYTGEGTFYGATGEGNCSYEASDDRMIAAMNHADYENSQACGAHLAVSGPSGVTITVKVVDQCPECSPGDIDLSAEAFAKLADPSAGRIPISWTLLSPDLDTPVSYRYKEGSSQWWCGIQVRDHRNPVRSVEVQVGSSWRNLPRKDYNYFVSDDGAGCGSAIRTTDIYGNTVTDTGITVTPGAVQPGTAQFGPPR